MASGGTPIQHLRRGIIFSGLFLLTATACAPDTRPPHDPQDLPAPERHAAHSARLREVMTDLNAIAYDRLPRELNTDLETERHLEQIARLAGSIAESAGDIPDAVNGLSLAAEDRAVFNGMARSLAADANHLREQAEMRRKDAVAATWGRVIERCDACHVRFRLTPLGEQS
jgi:cytochrome c556